MNSIRISFIIPAYNVEAYIEECITSIINQTCRDIEIIPVDDGSQDSTGVIIDRIAEQESRVRPIHKQNSGVSAARNAGIDAARGKYLAFVDGDDYIAEDYAEYMLNLAEKNDADFALSVNCFTKKGEMQISKDKVVIFGPVDAVALLLSPCVIVGSWNKLYRACLLKDYHIRFSTDMFYGEGLYFISQVAQRASRTAVGKRKVYYYRRNNYASATSRFDIGKFYNGAASIDAVERDLIINSPKVNSMLDWHRCQFKMGTVVRIKAAGLEDDYKDYYSECLSFVRKNLWRSLLIQGVSLYKKALLVGTAVSPRLMSLLDNWRRRRIQSASVVSLRKHLGGAKIAFNTEWRVAA